jgi:membrane protein
MNLKQVDWKTVGRAVFTEYNKDDVPGLSAELAYHFIFALFPFAIFLAALAGFVGHLFGSDQLFDQIMASLYGALPAASAESLSKPLSEVLQAQRAGALSIGALLALWSASNGVGTVMKAFNRAYGVEETRNFVVKKGLAVGMTVVLSLLLVSGFVLLAFGGQIGEWLANGLGLGGLFTATWNVVRIVASLIGISFALALLYWKGPNVDQQFRWLTPGSVMTTIVWALATVAFGFYVQLLGASSYSKTYGTAFGFILFLLYLYITSTIIMLGAELNAETGKRYDAELIRDKVTDTRKQLPGEQPAPDARAAQEAGVSRGQVVATNAASTAKVQSGQASAASPTLANASRSDGTTSKDTASETVGTAGTAAGTPHTSSNGRPAFPSRVDGSAAGPAHKHEVGIAALPAVVPAPEKDVSGKDRTPLATAAVSAAAVAGAVVLGALTHRNGHNERKKAA